MTSYGMTPEVYRERWKLPPDYPMVAPAYAERRSALAKSIGLGRKPGGVVAAEPELAPEPTPEEQVTPIPRRTAASWPKLPRPTRSRLGRTEGSFCFLPG